MTTPPPPTAPRRYLRPTDLRALASLAAQAVHGVIDLTEGVHQSVRRVLQLAPGTTPERAGGLTGRVYKGVRSVTQLVGRATDATLGAVLPFIDDPHAGQQDSPARLAALAALNGVLGDRLWANANPLAQPMQLCVAGQPLPLTSPHAFQQALPNATPHLLLLVHGLCMNDTQWLRHGHDHGASLAQALGATPLYLRYNSGRHVSENGRELAHTLQQLVGLWPEQLQRISIVGHSMGGLVARSAMQAGNQAAHTWVRSVQHLVFLGTPHHGAPLERRGHGVDVLLAATPFTAPFARLGQLRSTGITDLRHGNVVDADWQGRERFGSNLDHRQPLPLPEGVACFTVAGSLAPAPSPRPGLNSHNAALADWAQAGLGALAADGLVPLASALGQHNELRRRLVFAQGNQFIAWRTGHLDLLSSPAVAQQLHDWLTPLSTGPAEAD